jgi:hypothetical protein
MAPPIALQKSRRGVVIGGAKLETRLEGSPLLVLLQQYVDGQLTYGVVPSPDAGRQKVRSYKGGN